LLNPNMMELILSVMMMVLMSGSIMRMQGDAD
jgi:hypothetical protein